MLYSVSHLTWVGISCYLEDQLLLTEDGHRPKWSLLVFTMVKFYASIMMGTTFFIAASTEQNPWCFATTHLVCFLLHLTPGTRTRFDFCGFQFQLKIGNQKLVITTNICTWKNLGWFDGGFPPVPHQDVINILISCTIWRYSWVLSPGVVAREHITNGKVVWEVDINCLSHFLFQHMFCFAFFVCGFFFCVCVF